MQHITAVTGAPPQRAPYSLATIVGDFAFLAGQGPFTAENELLTGPFEVQARQTFTNIMTIVASLGRTSSDVARVGVYLRDLKKDFQEMNAIYAEFFPPPFPARTTIPTPGIRFDIEVDAVVWLGGEKP